jgi:hypothetical protein
MMVVSISAYLDTLSAVYEHTWQTVGTTDVVSFADGVGIWVGPLPVKDILGQR